MRATAPHRMTAPDLLGVIVIVGVVAWVLLAVRGLPLYELPRAVPHLSRVVRS